MSNTRRQKLCRSNHSINFVHWGDEKFETFKLLLICDWRICRQAQFQSDTAFQVNSWIMTWKSQKKANFLNKLPEGFLTFSAIRLHNQLYSFYKCLSIFSFSLHESIGWFFPRTIEIVFVEVLTTMTVGQFKVDQMSFNLLKY